MSVLENQGVFLYVQPAAGLRHKDGFCPQDLCSGLLTIEGVVETLAEALEIHQDPELLKKHLTKKDRDKSV